MAIVKVPKLTEKIYSEDISKGSIENKKTLRKFLLEYAKRKRGANIHEDGFHGGIVIMHDKWAAKVNEEDGKDYHTNTNMNLVRFLNNEHHFGTENEASKKALHENEVQAVIDNNMIVNLLSSKDTAKILIFCYNNNHSSYQLSIVRDILEIGKELVRKYPDGIEVGFFNSDGIIEEKYYTYEQKEKIETFLNQYDSNNEDQVDNKKSL